MLRWCNQISQHAGKAYEDSNYTFMTHHCVWPKHTIVLECSGVMSTALYQLVTTAQALTLFNCCCLIALRRVWLRWSLMLMCWNIDTYWWSGECFCRPHHHHHSLLLNCHWLHGSHMTCAWVSHKLLLPTGSQGTSLALSTSWYMQSESTHESMRWE